MKGQETTMKIKIRFILLSVSYIMLISGVISLLAYNEFSTSNLDLEKSQNYENDPTIQKMWLERLPRSIKSSKDYDIAENEIKTESDFGEKQNFEFYPKEKFDLVRTATPKPSLALDDVFISVKTTGSFHKTRLDIIIKTWLNMAPKQTWFFTDTDDPEYQEKTGNHLVNTNCSASHNRRALCCKMAREFDAFIESNKKWWCHFDDDNYVNIPALLSTLTSYDPVNDWYLGRPSIRSPLEILNRDNLSQKISFWFATGGAGFCISRSLALKMLPIAGGGRFISVGEKIRLPDDVTMGYIIEHVLKRKLTVVEEFHSHLEPMRLINLDTLDQQITFSYSSHGSEMNVLNIPGLPERVDSTRMYSLHCRLNPSSPYCAR